MERIEFGNGWDLGDFADLIIERCKTYTHPYKKVYETLEEMLNAFTVGMTRVTAADAMDCGYKVSRNALLVSGGHLSVEQADLINAKLIQDYAEQKAANCIQFLDEVRKEIASLEQEYGGVLVGRVLSRIDAVLDQHKQEG